MAVKPITTVNIEDRKSLNVHAGETVRVWQKIKEKDKVRLQAFEGLVLAKKHGAESGATFTVRKVVDGVGVEKIFPLYSPMIDKIEVIRRSKVRRAKLYYIREKASKEIRHNMRKMLALEPGQNTDTKIAGVAMSEAHADRVDAPKEETAVAEAKA